MPALMSMSPFAARLRMATFFPVFVFALLWAGPLLFSAEKHPTGVPPDAVYFKGKWYRVYLEGSGWKSSQAKCERNGGSLALVKVKETHDFLVKLANGRKLLIGASNYKNGVWTWVDGTIMGYQPWDRGQPNNVGGKEHCLSMGPKGAWYDVEDNSDWSQGYVCEWTAK